ncbi:membrane bound O-acyl transferase family-domain-containing protein [Suillus ampliporus]|nr:membrane bound O-acyl transferase family-domain-containing protein [Suillus ampliporus]
MISLSDRLRLPTARVPVTTESFVSDVLPPVICYFVTAFLVLLPRTQSIRIALWPITAFLAFCAATSLDMSMGKPKLQFLNIDLQLSMFCIGVRTLDWTVQTKPLIRSARRSATDVPKRNFVLDTLDLTCNLRGCGWDWSQGLYVPHETHPTSSRLAFATSTLISSLKYSFICGAIHSALQSFSPNTFGSVDGGTIFDDSLPPHLRYLRSSIIATLGAFGVYSVIRAGYEFTAVLCVLIFRQHPDQWPPSFGSPWRATSLREFWSRSWHQLFRRTFIFLGGYPLSLLFGRIGGVMGAFLASGLFHHVALHAIDPSSEMWRMLLPFGMMGVGVILERVVVGNKTGGWMGWMWTMFWLVLWGNVMVDGWARAGMLGGSSLLDSATPVRQPIERLVRMFDEYLRTS